jgi:hypothetical protein
MFLSRHHLVSARYICIFGVTDVIVQGLLATDGVNLSQATKYVEGATINGNNFCSQKAVKRYRNGFESDSDSDSN